MGTTETVGQIRVFGAEARLWYKQIRVFGAVGKEGW